MGVGSLTCDRAYWPADRLIGGSRGGGPASSPAQGRPAARRWGLTPVRRHEGGNDAVDACFWPENRIGDS